LQFSGQYRKHHPSAAAMGPIMFPKLLSSRYRPICLLHRRMASREIYEYTARYCPRWSLGLTVHTATGGPEHR
jgi:hypothetical protein